MCSYGELFMRLDKESPMYNNCTERSNTIENVQLCFEEIYKLINSIHLKYMTEEELRKFKDRKNNKENTDAKIRFLLGDRDPHIKHRDNFHAPQYELYKIIINERQN